MSRCLLVSGLCAMVVLAGHTSGQRPMIAELERHGRAGGVVVAGRGEERDQRFATYRVARADLNKRLAHDVFIETYVAPSPYRTGLTVVIQRGQAVDIGEETHRRAQMVPYLYIWQLRDGQGNCTHEWAAHFIHSRDLTYRTELRLPAEDKRRSYLLLYFEDVDGDGTREDVTYELDMTEYDWEGPPLEVRRQSVE